VCLFVCVCVCVFGWLCVCVCMCVCNMCVRVFMRVNVCLEIGRGRSKKTVLAHNR
jgi:hypothetical protein